MLDTEWFESITDNSNRPRLALKTHVPLRLLREMGLLTGETGGQDEDLRGTQIPVRVLREVRESCSYTADFGMVAEHDQFQAPLQLVIIPCRSSTGDGRCTRLGGDHSCTLFGQFSSIETSEREPVNLIIAPLMPGAAPFELDQAVLLKKRDRYHRSLRQWEDAFAPLNLLMDATTRNVQFWLRSWFGGG